jgi:hypothetical protein
MTGAQSASGVEEVGFRRLAGPERLLGFLQFALRADARESEVMCDGHDGFGFFVNDVC